MYALPCNLEVLNMSYNLLKKLDSNATMTLKNITTLDMSNNGIESLEGIQNMKRLRRLLLKNN
jgi:Leucine-rich repeat (LRR) protein